MSTIKSSTEHLTLNADGSGKDIKFQANGVEKASISSAGAFTSTSIDATKLSGALPAIDGSALTNLPGGGYGSASLRRKSDSQFIADATWTLLTFNVAGHDKLSEMTSTRFTATDAGVYHVSGQVVSGSYTWTLGRYVILTIRKNGTAISQSLRREEPVANARYKGSALDTDVELAAGDYIELFLLHNQGGGVVFANLGSQYHHFAVHRVA